MYIPEGIQVLLCTVQVTYKFDLRSVWGGGEGRGEGCHSECIGRLFLSPVPFAHLVS